MKRIEIRDEIAKFIFQKRMFNIILLHKQTIRVQCQSNQISTGFEANKRKKTKKSIQVNQELARN